MYNLNQKSLLFSTKKLRDSVNTYDFTTPTTRGKFNRTTLFIHYKLVQSPATSILF